MATAGVRRQAVTVLHLAPLRAASAVMLGVGAVLPLVPGEPGIPCALRSLTGIPCPLCGMTRSVTATVHLRWAEAMTMNPAGIAAVVVALALLALRRPAAVAVPSWAAPAGVAVLWAYQLWRAPPP